MPAGLGMGAGDPRPGAEGALFHFASGSVPPGSVGGPGKGAGAGAALTPFLTAVSLPRRSPPEAEHQRLWRTWHRYEGRAVEHGRDRREGRAPDHSRYTR